MSLLSLVLVFYYNTSALIGSKIIITWSPAGLWDKVRSCDRDARKQRARNVPLPSADVRGGGRLRSEPKECLPTRLHPARAERNTAGLTGKRIKCYSTKQLYLVVQFSPTSCAQGIISGWSFANCSFNFHFKSNRKPWLNREIVLQKYFRLRLVIWILLKDHSARLWRGVPRRLSWFAMFENS